MKKWISSKLWSINNSLTERVTLSNYLPNQVLGSAVNYESYGQLYCDLLSKVSFQGHVFLYDTFVNDRLSLVPTLPKKVQIGATGCFSIIIKHKLILFCPMIVDLQTKKVLLVLSTDLQAHLQQITGTAVLNRDNSG